MEEPTKKKAKTAPKNKGQNKLSEEEEEELKEGDNGESQEDAQLVGKVIVDIACYTSFLREQLQKKKAAATKLRSYRRFSFKIQPCPIEVYIELLCSCDELQWPLEEVTVKNPRKLDPIFGAKWELDKVITDGVDDGWSCLNGKLNCPIVFRFNVKKSIFELILFWILYNKQGCCWIFGAILIASLFLWLRLRVRAGSCWLKWGRINIRFTKKIFKTY